MLIIFRAVFPSPNGLTQPLLRETIWFAALRIRCELVPANIFEPTSIVPGLSVLSLNVTQGTPRMQPLRPRAPYKSTKSQLNPHTRLHPHNRYQTTLPKQSAINLGYATKKAERKKASHTRYG
jgi:hypothetical protein